MKFNPQLKDELKKYETIMATKSSATTAQICTRDEEQRVEKVRGRPSEKVVGGDILWKPIDRAAAMLLAKAPWWAQPPQVEPPKAEPDKKQRKSKKERKGMVKHASEINGDSPGCDNGWVVFGDYAIQCKMKDKRTGEPLFATVDMWPILLEQLNAHKNELSPAALALTDGAAAINKAMPVLKDAIADMCSHNKVFLEDIRQTKFALTTEIASITTSLRDIRRFFFEDEYKEQIARLTEFVCLCERLQRLKQAGFLDSIADTMLRLADKGVANCGSFKE